MDQEVQILRNNAPRDELAILIREAVVSVEADLALEDAGWVNLSAMSGDVISSADRIVNLKLSRLYAIKDPMGKQAIRLWTDYTFGSGMVWSVDEDNKATKKALESFWDSKENQGVLSARGQRKSSDKLLIDGEVFFAIALGASTQTPLIRRINPLEITEIITDIDDKEKVMFYKREWADVTGKSHIDYYRDTTNPKGDPAIDYQGMAVHKTEDALIYHLAYNTITQRGNPLLLPALTWMKYNNKFLSSRIAIMLALARFALKQKVKGGQAQVDAIKAKTNAQQTAAGSTAVENLGVETTVMKQETGASGAYQDGKMIKLMIAAAVGIPEQYFGDIGSGNWATAKTVELPMQKMFQSYQAVWADTYKDIDEIVLAHYKIDEDKWYVDRDFPAIAPPDAQQAAQALVQVISVMPEFADLPDVQQVALMILGIDDTAEVLETLAQEASKNGHNPVKLIKALREYRRSQKE